MFNSILFYINQYIMGNKISGFTKSEQPQDNNEIIDYIATYYILTMDFENLKKLNDQQYCDKLVILTSDIINRYFTPLEITNMEQRIKNGVVEKENAVFIDKDDLNSINNTDKKKTLCISIAKFYIKVSHIFAAIVMTLNPVYTYTDSQGNQISVSLYNKHQIPANADRVIQRFNICENRLNSLSYKWNPVLKNVHPKMCDMNFKSDNTNKKVKSLADEPGVPELKELYYDDNYDSNTGKFTGMSANTHALYMKNLEMFYKIFTNNEKMGPDVKSFSDIKLRDYHNNPNCSEDGAYRMNYENDGSSLFTEYATNLKKMMSQANSNQTKLMDILNKMFVYTINPNTRKNQVRVNPKLSEHLLDEIVVETRTLIINLYLTCEKDYARGLNIYEAIVEKKIFDSSQNQIKKLKKEHDDLLRE
jgi:hypothetical protein